MFKKLLVSMISLGCLCNPVSAEHIWVDTNVYGGGQVVEELWIDDMKLDWFTERFGNTGGLLQVKSILTLKGEKVPEGYQAKVQLYYFFKSDQWSHAVSLKDGSNLEYYFSHNNMGRWHKVNNPNTIKCLSFINVQKGQPVFAEIVVKSDSFTDEKLYAIYQRAINEINK